MIQQKKATDAEIYKRYKNVGKGHPMYEYIQWFKRGKQPKNRGTHWHDKAHAKIVELLKTYSVKQLAEHLDTYPSLIYRLNKRDYRYVRDRDAKRIATTDYSELTAKKPDVSLMEQYRKAQKVLQSEHDFWVVTYADLGRKYGVDKGKIAKCIRDEYVEPHLEIIEAVNGD